MVRALEPMRVDGHEMTLVKLLDLLTNRYHVGVLRTMGAAVGMDGAEAMCVEMPTTVRLSAGQRVKCVVSDGTRGVLAKRSMRRAQVMQVLPGAADLQRVHLAMMGEN